VEARNGRADAGTKDLAKASPIKIRKGHSGFYAGVLAAPDLSTVKFQSVKGMGFTTGILLGYSLNRRWAIETGFYLDFKKYYSEGQYFNKDKVPLLQYTDLNNVDGNCNMFEIPVNIRYNLNQGDKHVWFATAGLSTYLMTKEYYAFDGYRNGTYWSGARTYKNPYQYWFSVMNLSLGFEERLGRIGSLRLEPYLRVPLSGIGTGSLPILSAGLNIGITRRFR
jgi:hypothetical protein